MKTDELIVELTRSLEPVQRLSAPVSRLARWTLVSLSMVAVGVLAIGPRADISSAIRQPAFAVLAILALTTSVVAAACALVLSIPGAERSPAQRGIPVLAGAVWVLTLTAMLVDGGAVLARLVPPPVHLACIVEITGFAVLPGWALFTMLRRAAPLQVVWSAALAAFAAAAMGVAATQVVCPVDEPAHHLVGHMVPMALLTIATAAVWRRSLVWFRAV